MNHREKREEANREDVDEKGKLIIRVQKDGGVERCTRLRRMYKERGERRGNGEGVREKPLQHSIWILLSAIWKNLKRKFFFSSHAVICHT